MNTPATLQASQSQTVYFAVRVFRNRIETPMSERTGEVVYFATLEEVRQYVVKERNRRSLKDRATSAEYRLHLTDLHYRKMQVDADYPARAPKAEDLNWMKW